MSGKPPGTRWITGYEGRYALSPEGVVWSVLRAFPRPVTVRVGHAGRRKVTLRLRAEFRLVHGLAGLVLLTFGPRRKPGYVPIHRDGDPANCALANLRWGTPAARRQRLLRSGVLGYKLSVQDVQRIRRSRRGATVVAAVYGVSSRHVRRIRRGDQRAAIPGYRSHWRQPA